MQMAKASIGYNYHMPEDNVLYDDIWSQKARHRMSTARERKPLTFNAPMSAEAATAMQQVAKSSSNKTQVTTSRGKQGTRLKAGKGKEPPSADRFPEAKHVCSVKLSDFYEKLGAVQKLDGDITDPNTWDESATKFVLGGGKMENAMEIVEIVNADDPKPQVETVEYIDDEHAIAEIARINSINKCNVWFEAHESLLESSEKSTEREQKTVLKDKDR